MKVVLVAPFLMPFRISGDALSHETGSVLRDAVAAVMPEFDMRAHEDLSEMLFDHHTSTGGTRLYGAVTDGTAEVEGLGPVWLRFEPLGLGFVFHTLELAGRDELHVREAEIATALRPYIRRWSDAIGEQMRQRMTDPPPGAMESGRLLWWHRVLIDPPEGEEPTSTRVFGTERKIHDDAYCRVGDGFTTLVRLPERRLSDVLDGLCSATEEWLGVDEANRLVSGRLAALREGAWRNVADVDEQFRAALQLSRDLSLRDLIRREQDRYLVNVGMLVKQAALECWRVAGEKETVDNQVQTLRDMLDYYRTMTQWRQDERRNGMLFVFTVVTVIQSVLLWYDFATSREDSLGSALRLALDALVGVVTVGAVAIALRAGGGRGRGRRRWLRLPGGRGGGSVAARRVRPDSILPSQAAPAPEESAPDTVRA